MPIEHKNGSRYQRFTIELPEEVYWELKEIAVQLRRNLKQVMLEAFIHYVESMKRGKK